MKKSRDIHQGLGFGYTDSDGRICMIRCFECGRENYSPAVATGYCGKCSHNANEKPRSTSTSGSKKLSNKTLTIKKESNF